MLTDNAVYCAKSPVTAYSTSLDLEFSELPPETVVTPALVALRNLLVDAGLDRERLGLPEWNPFAELVSPGQRVVIKPNWVLHENHSGQGMNCLVTHTTVIEAILTYLVKAGPSSIVVGDAPIQGCDFESLRRTCQLDRLLQYAKEGECEITIRDFRRTVLPGGKLGGQALVDRRPMGDYVLVDLGAESLLENISQTPERFRVAMYDPDALMRTHCRGRHQYLVIRDILEADLVINVPKLKTHKKAGVTGALKNMVGMNGLKDYLPHHRLGDPTHGGDCYEKPSVLRALAEYLLDQTNRSQQWPIHQLFARSVSLPLAVLKVLGRDREVDGSWYGNDTVWRMCLDLQTILHYARLDGNLADQPQRRVVTITDAIIAGEGNGPLAPEPVPMGMLTMGSNVAALEWVHALLMRLDPTKIPLIREAFAPRRHALTGFQPENIVVSMDGHRISIQEILSEHSHAFKLPRGWQGQCGIGLPHQPSATVASGAYSDS